MPELSARSMQCFLGRMIGLFSKNMKRRNGVRAADSALLHRHSRLTLGVLYSSIIYLDKHSSMPLHGFYVLSGVWLVLSKHTNNIFIRHIHRHRDYEI